MELGRQEVFWGALESQPCEGVKEQAWAEGRTELRCSYDWVSAVLWAALELARGQAFISLTCTSLHGTVFRERQDLG